MLVYGCKSHINSSFHRSITRVCVIFPSSSPKFHIHDFKSCHFSLNLYSHIISKPQLINWLLSPCNCNESDLYSPRSLSRFGASIFDCGIVQCLGWLFKFSATVVVGVAVVAYVWKQSRLRTNNARDVGTSREPQVNAWEDPELTCSCGLRARLKISRTSKNSYRLFYNCPKHIFHHQCDFFRWCDEMATTIDSCVDEKNFLHNECVRLQERIDYLRFRREQDRVVWEREKAELRSKLSAVEAELDDIKRGIRQVIESDAMPPFDDSYESDAKYDGAVVIEMVSRP